MTLYWFGIIFTSKYLTIAWNLGSVYNTINPEIGVWARKQISNVSILSPLCWIIFIIYLLILVLIASLSENEKESVVPGLPLYDKDKVLPRNTIFHSTPTEVVCGRLKKWLSSFSTFPEEANRKESSEGVKRPIIFFSNLLSQLCHTPKQSTYTRHCLTVIFSLGT